MTITKVYDGVTPSLRHIIQAVKADTRPLMADLGKTLEVDLRAHFAARNREGNRRGWPTRNFWSREGRDKTALIRVGDKVAVVGIASPAVAHKVKGGTIRPQRGRALAIPVREEAYEEGSPKNWTGKAFGGEKLFRPRGKRYLAVRDGKAIRVQYILVGSVTQDPDPRALPDPAVVERHLIKRAEAWRDQVLRAAHRKGGTQ